MRVESLFVNNIEPPSPLRRHCVPAATASAVEE
jgi:hypothetical protein